MTIKKNRTGRVQKARALRCTVAAIALSLTVFGCATAPPVQEMSDARQAIAAAEEAAADELAPDSLDDARRFLETAEQQLREASYGAARVNAVRARNRAVQALETSQEAAARDEE